MNQQWIRLVPSFVVRAYLSAGLRSLCSLSAQSTLESDTLSVTIKPWSYVTCTLILAAKLMLLLHQTLKFKMCLKSSCWFASPINSHPIALLKSQDTPLKPHKPKRCPSAAHIKIGTFGSRKKLETLWVFPCSIMWQCLCSMVELATIFLRVGFHFQRAACSVSSATSLGLRIFRNTTTTLSQAEYRSMSTEAPWALHPQKFLKVTVTDAQGLSFGRKSMVCPVLHASLLHGCQQCLRYGTKHTDSK